MLGVYKMNDTIDMVAVVGGGGGGDGDAVCGWDKSVLFLHVLQPLIHVEHRSTQGCSN